MSIIPELRKEIIDLKQENFILTGDLVAMKKTIEPLYKIYKNITGHGGVDNPALKHIIRIVLRGVK